MQPILKFMKENPWVLVGFLAIFVVTDQFHRLTDAWGPRPIPAPVVPVVPAPKPDPAPVVPVVPTPPANIYAEPVTKVFVGELALEDTSYLAGAFEGLADFVAEEDAMDDAGDFIAFWKEVSPPLVKQVQGKYDGFQAVIEKMLNEIEKASEPHRKDNTYFSKEHRQEIAKEMMQLKEALSQRASDLLE